MESNQEVIVSDKCDVNDIRLSQLIKNNIYSLLTSLFYGVKLPISTWIFKNICLILFAENHICDMGRFEIIFEPVL